MSYHDFVAKTKEGRIGQAIYMKALDGRRGFRYDQLGIDDDEIWEEIFEDIGKNAFFDYNDATHTLGMNDKVVNFSDPSAASYKIMQGLIKQAQLRDSYPYLFDKRSDNTYYYNGKNTPADLNDRKELVSKLSDDVAERILPTEAKPVLSLKTQ